MLPVISYISSSEDGVNNPGSESVTNEVEMAGGSEVSIDNLENMELIDEENMPNNLLLLSVSELDEEVYVNQPLSIVSSLDDDPSFEDLNCFQSQLYLNKHPRNDEGSPRNQEFGSPSLAPDYLCLLSKSHSWPNCDDLDADDVVPADAGSPLPDEKQHSTPANTDASSNSMDSDDNFVASADVSIVPEQSEEKMSFVVAGLYNSSVGLLWRPSLQPLAKFSHYRPFNRCYTESWQELAGVLVFSAIPFTAVKAIANSPLGETLQTRMQEQRKLLPTRPKPINYSSKTLKTRAALKLNKNELMGRSVRLELAKERGAFTPGSRNEKPYKKGQGTVSVRVKNALEKHFGNCGEITRTFITKDYESGDLLELDQSKVGGKLINVEEARPRDDSLGPRCTPESVRKEGPATTTPAAAAAATGGGSAYSQSILRMLYN
ncbi:hypothetical protein Tco_0015800 [Tanacetum coccineum]